ncbi:MAG: AAA family ATPase [Alphaproteobacteria bacterium]|nr:AAA family ATPase [Alphaproteobacteria bacterium]
MAEGKIIVIGNEKGGTGKSTLAMHLIVWFLRQKKRVASVDLDGRQGTLTHYIQNRAAYGVLHHIELGLPEHLTVTVRENPTEQECEADKKAFHEQLTRLQKENDLIVIDTAGADSYLFRLAHAAADILITPINDSLIDLDVLAKVEPETLTVKAPGHYAQTVWQARQKRAAARKRPVRWFVLRNRVMHVSTHNEKLIWKLLEALGQRINFMPLRGLGERIIFRELFLKGLTLLDIGQSKTGVAMSMTHVAARQELRSILQAIGEESLADG